MHAVRRSCQTAPCSTIDYQVQQDCNYYFVFYLDSVRPTGLNIEFQFNRTVYLISPNMVVMINNCSFPLDRESSSSISFPDIQHFKACRQHNFLCGLQRWSGNPLQLSASWLALWSNCVSCSVCSYMLPCFRVYSLCYGHRKRYEGDTFQ